MQEEKGFLSTVPRNFSISSYTALEFIKDISTINTTSGFITEKHKIRKAASNILRGSAVWFQVFVHLLAILAKFSNRSSDKPRSRTLKDQRLADLDFNKSLLGRAME